MDLFDLTLASPQENLALDEALLDEAEESSKPRESLRLWEAAAPLVIVGRNSQLAAEVRLDACQKRGIPVLRRASGGSAIVAGPGCLMYAVVLSYRMRPEMRMLEAAHRQVLETTLAALRPVVGGIVRQGTSDLALGDLKISGNSLRCRRRTFLYHGTLLYDFPLELMDQCLSLPPRQPDYRRGRANQSFLTNLPADVDALRQALVEAWEACPPKRDWPRRRVKELVANRYSQPDWNLKR
ncbi:MAG: lipoate--protein ligase family protein [Pirellulales bacterium]